MRQERPFAKQVAGVNRNQERLWSCVRANRPDFGSRHQKRNGFHHRLPLDDYSETALRAHL